MSVMGLAQSRIQLNNRPELNIATARFAYANNFFTGNYLFTLFNKILMLETKSEN